MPASKFGYGLGVRSMIYSLKCTVAAFGFLLAAGCGGPKDATGPAAPTSGSTARAEAATTESQLRKNGPAPVINATTIRGDQVDFAKLKSGADLVIEFFFSPETGEEIGLKLKSIDLASDSIHIIALGFEEDKDALKSFAAKNGIEYYIIDSEALAGEPWIKDITELPLTLFVNPSDSPTITKLVRGGGKDAADIVRKIARTILDQNKPEAARAVAGVAQQVGEDARDVTAYSFVAEGKLDDAEGEFKAIGSNEGLARVELDRGNPEKAMALADQAGDGAYAQVIKSESLQQLGNFVEAENALKKAVEAPGEDWQKSEAAGQYGRLAHYNKDAKTAAEMYAKAADENPYNMAARTNQAEVLRESGDFAGADAMYAQATDFGGDRDDYLVMARGQNQRDLVRKNSNEDILINGETIKELGKRFREQKEAGTAVPVDPWSTKPHIITVWYDVEGTPPYFQRAGADILNRREIETRLGQNEHFQVVEREKLGALLQELNLGSSDLADKQTQQQLGKVLSARNIIFLDLIGRVSQNLLMPRTVEVETTLLQSLPPQEFDQRLTGLGEKIQTVVDAITGEVIEKKPLQGLIATSDDTNNIMINIGRLHGVDEGMRFAILKEGEAVVVGGRELGRQSVPVGIIEVVTREDSLSYCKLVKLDEGAELGPETKIKQMRATQ